MIVDLRYLNNVCLRLYRCFLIDYAFYADASSVPSPPQFHAGSGVWHVSGGMRRGKHMAPLVVLLVDSSPIFLQSAVRFLEGYAPDQILVGGAVNDGADALALVERLRPHVVLWGIGMPALPQLRHLPQLRALLPQARIIVLGFLDEGYRQAALAAGADMFLLKDDLTATLLPAIIDVAHGRRDV
jgi:CheY-like chemotaxis protein